MKKIFDLIDKVLIFDVFLVMFGFVWFLVALIGKSLEITFIWDIWYKLWQPLFNPAISIMIAGAFLSWASKKISNTGILSVKK